MGSNDSCGRLSGRYSRPMSALARLLDLQEVDTRLAQLRHRIAHLPEMVEVERLKAEIARVDAGIRELAAENTALSQVLAAAESRTNDIRAKTARLNAQLKTVIAPREAEALQHEISVLATESSELDDSALTALDRSETLDAETQERQRERAIYVNDLAAAESVAREAAESVEAEIHRVDAQRTELSGDIDAALLSAYESRRSMHSGIAVARLSRSTCGGCHIDLSTTEIESLRRSDETERECPNCARWLVL